MLVVPGQNVTIHAHGYQDETVSSGIYYFLENEKISFRGCSF